MSGFAAWVRQYFDYRQGSERSLTADSNGDGESQFAEYAFLGDPVSAGRSNPVGVSGGAQNPDGSWDISITLRARLESDVSYALNTSTDLTAWSPSSIAHNGTSWQAGAGASVIASTHLGGNVWEMTLQFNVVPGNLPPRFFSLIAWPN